MLSRKKFNFNKDRINDLIEVFLTSGINAERMISPDTDFPDKDDIVFYEVKMSKENAYLVTGNIRHFPIHPLIVTPAEMVKILQDKGLI